MATKTDETPADTNLAIAEPTIDDLKERDALIEQLRQQLADQTKENEALKDATVTNIGHQTGPYLRLTDQQRAVIELVPMIPEGCEDLRLSDGGTVLQVRRDDGDSHYWDDVLFFDTAVAAWEYHKTHGVMTACYDEDFLFIDSADNRMKRGSIFWNAQKYARDPALPIEKNPVIYGDMVRGFTF